LKLTLIILPLLLLTCGCSEKPKAVFVIVDGIPADVLENVPTPNLDAIAGEHGYTRGYVGGVVGQESESPTVSAVSYNSLLTGTWSNKNNVWTNSIKDPNYAYWDIFRIAKHHDASLQTAVFSTWTDNRTKLLGDGLEAAGGFKLDHYVDGFELDEERFPQDDKAFYIRDIDIVVADAAAGYIESDGPDLSWVYLQYSDDVAHFHGDGPELNAVVQFMDAQVGKIWNAIQHRQATNNEDWMILVTTDHGRDVETGRDHGGQTERERTIWIATNSDDLNARYHQDPAIVDILPSVATHLQLQIPADIAEQLDGQSFID
jgi:predicted AlkP superfamily pyrophosphatase or phosphodiesterase